MNISGTACRICDIMSKKTGVKTSSDFKWKVEAGKLVVLDGTEVVLESKVSEPPTAKEVVEAKPAPVKVKKEKPVPRDEPELVNIPDVKGTVLQKPVPRDEPELVNIPDVKGTVLQSAFGEVLVAPALGESLSERGPFMDLDITTERERFTILIGCAVIESKIKGGGKFGSPACRVTAEELMIVVETEMIRLMGAAKWTEMNTFAKRDAIQAMSEQIAESLGGSTLTVTRLPKASLLETVVMGIRPYAKEVIQAVME